MAEGGKRGGLDETKKRVILQLLQLGCSRTAAARCVGCSVSTIRRTAARDPAFAEALRPAENAAQIGYLKNIKKAAEKEQYWRAAAWALERLNPEDFAPRHPDVITLDQLKRVLAEFAEIVGREVLADEDRRRVLQRLAALSAELGQPVQEKTETDEALPQLPDEQ